MCEQCGLRTTITLPNLPAYSVGETPPELDTTVLKPVAVMHKVESRLPALLVICAVVALAVGMVLAGAHKNDNTAQATAGTTLAPATATAEPPTPVTHITMPTLTVMSLSEPPAPTSIPLVLPTYTALPLPTFTSIWVPPATEVPPATVPAEAPAEQGLQPARLLPGVGGFAGDFNGWWVKLDGIASRPVLWSVAPDTRHDPQGTFWVAYLVYRNEAAEAHSLGATLDFVLKGSDGDTYPELSEHGTDPQLRNIAVAQQANPLDYTVAAGDRTTTLLVFDLPAGVRPTALAGSILQDGQPSNQGQVAWDLSGVK